MFLIRVKFPPVIIFINITIFIIIIIIAIATRRPHLHSHQSDAPQYIKTLDSTVIDICVATSTSPGQLAMYQWMHMMDSHNMVRFPETSSKCQ
jgi:hypothetical protein